MSVAAAALDGRRILITGGGSGIGAALAEACAQAGARVGIIGRDVHRLARVADRTGAATAVADITIRAQAEKAVASIAQQLGGIDVLVNNAGAMLHSRISAGRAEDWEQMLDINVLGVLHVTHATLEHLRAAEHADIVNISSIAADRVSLPDFAIYAATKASVLRITEALRADLAKDGDIRVAVIKPGMTKTDGFGPGIRDPQLRAQVEAAKEKTGMQPSALAAQICHVIAAPRTVCIEEMVVMPHRPA
jgi:NADP-dependent 3-hydroxy acid dehydrogenase YdfG